MATQLTDSNELVFDAEALCPKCHVVMLIQAIYGEWALYRCPICHSITHQRGTYQAREKVKSSHSNRLRSFFHYLSR